MYSFILEDFELEYLKKNPLHTRQTTDHTTTAV
jgi:hypothetical protein